LTQLFFYFFHLYIEKTKGKPEKATGELNNKKFHPKIIPIPNPNKCRLPENEKGRFQAALFLCVFIRLILQEIKYE
jgi:hypothetical protein